MFCAKCGAEIGVSDQFCPKCGHENINYQPADKRGATRVPPPLGKSAKQHTAGRKIRHTAIAICILTLAAAGAILFFVKGDRWFGTDDTDQITYSPQGLTGYIGMQDVIHFVADEEVISFPVKATMGRSTPDHTKFLILQDDGKLKLYNSQGDAGTLISNPVSRVPVISDEGCYFEKSIEETDLDHLYYYDFETQETTDTEMECEAFVFSHDKSSVAGISENGELRLYSKGDASSKTLCTVEDGSEICCVADGGTNVLWSTKDGSTHIIYMLSDGVPERVGKITNPEKYSHVSGYFYDGGRSFYAYSLGSTQLLLCRDGQIKEIALPGVNESGMFQRASADDTQAEFYMIVNKIKSQNVGSLYRLSSDGTLSLIVDGISQNDGWWYDAVLPAGRNKVLCINGDKDLYVKGIDKNKDETLITTDVKTIFVPAQGKYAYVIKSGSLYYIDLSDKEYTLHLIENTITEHDKVYMTDEPDTIYYITDSRKIKEKENEYRYKGTLFQYSVGGTAIKVSDNIIGVAENDRGFISAEHPLLEKYVHDVVGEGSQLVIDIGTCRDGGYKTLVKTVKYP